MNTELQYCMITNVYGTSYHGPPAEQFTCHYSTLIMGFLSSNQSKQVKLYVRLISINKITKNKIK